MSSTAKTCKLKITMLSDWHIGTGAGRPGSVDKLVARDKDGFPFIPAKTLNGIWRDALETLTRGLDNGKESNWSKFVELIFGVQPTQLQGVQPQETQAAELSRRAQRDAKTYSNSLLFIQPARLPKSLRSRIGSFPAPDRKRYLSALTFIKPGVAIEENGTAKPDYLRFEEMGRSGAVLEAEFTLRLESLDDASAEQVKTIQSLLVTSAKLVERIGGKRRRGAGRCQLTVEWQALSLADAIVHLQSYEGNSAPPVPFLKQVQRNYTLQKSEVSDGWQCLPFSLRLQTPIAIVTATLGNVSEALDFIPGTYLLPHITRVLSRELDKDIFGAVAYGDFRVLSATPEIQSPTGEKFRGLPTPKVIAQEKVGGGFDKSGKKTPNTLYNRLQEALPLKEQTKAVRSGYIQTLSSITLSHQGKKLPQHKSPSQTLLMHSVIKDDLQRPTEDVGGVFSRQAIAAGTTLRGELRLRKDLAKELAAIASDWQKKLHGSVRLGTSKKDDYGLAELEILQEIPSSTVTLNGKHLVVYLESDVLLRGETLRQTNLLEDFRMALNNRVNIENIKLKERELTQEEKRAGKISRLIETRRIESWHEGWGFPRPTLIAMAAGSCMVFEIEGFDTLSAQQQKSLQDALETIEAEGIGERRGEGYGQLRFNPALLTQAINDWQPADKPHSEEAPRDFAETLAAEDFVIQIENAVWREELQLAVLKMAMDKDERNKIFGFDLQEQRPPMSQIGGLRSVISRLHSSEGADKELILSWLRNLEKTSNRLNAWAKDNEGKAKKKIENIAELIRDEKPEFNVWQRLGDSWREPQKLTNRDLKKEFWAEAVRSLFDACARAYKRDLEKAEGNHGTEN